jgi:hypothetical protein
MVGGQQEAWAQSLLFVPHCALASFSCAPLPGIRGNGVRAQPCGLLVCLVVQGSGRSTLGTFLLWVGPPLSEISDAQMPSGPHLTQCHRSHCPSSPGPSYYCCAFSLREAKQFLFPPSTL